jgi:AraC-like DNA-binding protein
MLLLKRRPSAAISRFVDYLWLLSDAPPHARERILPTGTLELVINLQHDGIRIYDEAGVCQPFSGTLISGAYDRPFEIDTTAHARIMGVHFRPGGAAPFTRFAPGELANAHVDAATLWGASHAAQLRERLCSAVTHQERFDVLDGSLVAQAERAGRRRTPVLEAALPRLLQPEVNVSEIVASLGISHRHFAALFRREVGMTPKLFARIQRFQRVIAVARERAEKDCARLASDCGYFDQSHMNRDFATFARATPREYLRMNSEETKEHHVALR